LLNIETFPHNPLHIFSAFPSDRALLLKVVDIVTPTHKLYVFFSAVSRELYFAAGRMRSTFV